MGLEGLKAVAPVATRRDAGETEVKVAKGKLNHHVVTKGADGCRIQLALGGLFSAACLAAFITLLVIGKQTNNRAMMLGAIGPGLALFFTNAFLTCSCSTPKGSARVTL